VTIGPASSAPPSKYLSGPPPLAFKQFCNAPFRDNIFLGRLHPRSGPFKVLTYVCAFFREQLLPTGHVFGLTTLPHDPDTFPPDCLVLSIPNLSEQSTLNYRAVRSSNSPPFPEFPFGSPPSKRILVLPQPSPACQSPFVPTFDL